MIKPKLEALLTVGVDSKADLKARLAAEHNIKVSLGTLNGWLYQSDLLHVFDQDRQFRLLSKTQSSNPKPERAASTEPPAPREEVPPPQPQTKPVDEDRFPPGFNSASLGDGPKRTSLGNITAI